MGDDMEEEEREQDRRYRIVKSLRDLIQEMMLKMNVKNLMRLRKALEEVVEEEEERYGRRGGLENSAVNRVSGLIFIALLARTPFFNRTPIAEEEMIRCLSLVLRRCNMEEYKLFSDVHTYLLDSITDSPFMPIVKPLSEEVKMSVLASWSQMSRGALPRVREKVWGEAYRGKLGHTIYLCLSFVKNETSKSLRLQAIHTVQDLGWKDACPSLTKQEKDSLSGAFVNFLPGIVQAMTKVATGSDTQGSKIIAAAVDTWSYYVTLVMGDSYLSSHVPHLGESVVLVNLRHNLERGESGGGGYEINEEEEEEEEEKGMEFDHLGRPTLPNMKVTRKWVRKTEGNVGVLAGALTPLATHQHWLVRHSMARWAAALVTECVRALPSCLSPALEVLLTLRQDDMEEVADAAVEAMGKLREAGEEGGGRQKLEELVKKKVISLSTRLPSIVRQEDDAKTLGAVRQLEGCLEVLGGQGMQPLLSSPNVHRLLHSLSLLLSLNTADSHLLHQRSSALDPFEAPLLKPHMGRSFTHFRDKRILEVVGRACGLLGRHGELVRLVHLCVDLLHLHTTTHLYSEGLLLLSLVLDGVLVGTTDTEVEERQHSVQLILDEVLSPEVLGSHLLCTLEEENTLASLLTPVPPPSSPVEGARVRVVRVIQALGVVRACARLMGHNFTQFLSIILCPVMEFAGLANMAVSLAATEALKQMSEACGCVDVGEFIRESTPHLWYPLSMRLKRLTEYPAAAVVLQVALRYTGTQMQAFTEELVEEAVIALDQHHVQAADPMLRVLLAYVSVVAAEETSKNDSGTQDSENGDCGAENSGKGDSKGENSVKSDSPVVTTFKGDSATLNDINNDSKKQNSSKCDSHGQSSVQGNCAVDATCTGDSVTLNSEKGDSEGQNNNNKGEEEENEEGVEKVKVEEEESEKVMQVVGLEESGEDVNKEEAEEKVMQEIKPEYHGAIAKFLQEYHSTKMSIKRGLEEEEEEEERLTEEEERMNWETEKMSTSHNTSSNPPPPAHTPSPPPEPAEPTPPRNIELVRDVVERCSYLLHIGGREGLLLTLEVARWGCRALCNWENLLLPCTHKLWRPILLLLSQPDPVVGTRALALVSELVALSGDFLRRRVLQEALPLVLKFLESQASVSIGAKECQSPALKAQRTCLTILATLIPALQLGVTEAGSVVGVVGSYLDPHHPPDLFHGALGVLRVMSRSHPHHVWLALALRRPPVQLVHPSHHIPAVKIGSTRHQGPLPTEAEELFQELS